MIDTMGGMALGLAMILVAILFLSWLGRHAILSTLDLIDVIRSIRDPAKTDLGVHDDPD